MRKIIEHTLVSGDGVFAEADSSGFFANPDDAYMREDWANCWRATPC
jgi:hypothetical protein